MDSDLRYLVTAIFSHVPGTWDFTQSAMGGDGILAIRTDRRARIRVCQYGSDRDTRLEFQSLYPEWLDVVHHDYRSTSYLPYRLELPKHITISCDRPVEQIARNFVRRMLAPYDAFMDVFAATEARLIEKTNALTALLARMNALFPDHEPAVSKDAHWYVDFPPSHEDDPFGTSFTVELRSLETLEINLRNVPIELGASIVTLVRDWHAGNKGESDVRGS